MTFGGWQRRSHESAFLRSRARGCENGAAVQLLTDEALATLGPRGRTPAVGRAEKAAASFPAPCDQVRGRRGFDAIPRCHPIGLTALILLLRCPGASGRRHFPGCSQGPSRVPATHRTEVHGLGRVRADRGSRTDSQGPRVPRRTPQGHLGRPPLDPPQPLVSRNLHRQNRWLRRVCSRRSRQQAPVLRSPWQPTRHPPKTGQPS